MATTDTVLFSWPDVEKLPELHRLEMAPDALPDEELASALEAVRGRGRDDYPVRAMWRAFVAGGVTVRSPRWCASWVAIRRCSRCADSTRCLARVARASVSFPCTKARCGVLRPASGSTAPRGAISSAPGGARRRYPPAQRPRGAHASESVKGAW